MWVTQRWQWVDTPALLQPPRWRSMLPAAQVPTPTATPTPTITPPREGLRQQRIRQLQQRGRQVVESSLTSLAAASKFGVLRRAQITTLAAMLLWGMPCAHGEPERT